MTKFAGSFLCKIEKNNILSKLQSDSVLFMQNK